MAALSDKITDTRNAARPNTARVSSSRSSGGATLNCDNLTGWPTASKVHFVTYQIDSNSNPVNGTQLDAYGIVSGNDITSFTVVDGTDNGNSVGEIVEMLPTAAWGQDLSDALLASHNRDGTLKAGAVNNSNVMGANTVDSAAYVDGSIDGEHLSTTAITLGYAQITSSFVSASTSDADVTGLSVAVTVPTGGRRVKISVFVPYIQSGGGGTATEIAIKEGATTLSRTRANNPAGATNPINNPVYSAAVTAGAHTYKVALKNDSAVNATIGADATFPAFILVEAI